MLPYPSGRLHMGYVRNYSIGDALSRYMWMRGYNVQHPMGWDAFGLPAENAAIQRGMHAGDWTISNIGAMKSQMHRMGFAYDWNLEIATCEPEYYKWNQWFFLKMFERGLAYRKKAMVNWCPECATVLANEQVVDGCCWRHETTPVEQRALEQWFWKITDYAEELLRDTYEKLEGTWPERVLSMQRNWIGRSEGSEIDFALEGGGEKIRVFTTRVDTIYGATCLILAPEHPLAQKLLDDAGRIKARQMIDARKQMGPGDIVKDGAFTGHYAINPYSGEKIPIWIGNFVLIDYGTGAIMAVPAHDERDFDFAKTFGIAIRPVIRPADAVLGVDPAAAFTDDGITENTGEFSGLPSAEARRKMNAYAEHKGFGKAAIPYLIKDWGISRQRYWGTPIPMIHCPKCGVVPVPEKGLPVILPYDVKFTGKGRSPLAEVASFMNVKCPQCGADGQRESDTMDTFVDSSWYFYRYCDPKNDKAPYDSTKIAYWFPIDQYIGGITHAILHLLYSRFWCKVMRDIGLITHNEPIARRFTQGIVQKGGVAMSKSRGNVVGAEDMAQKYGADTGRLYTLFAAPPEKDLEWSEESIEGSWRFLNSVYRLVDRHAGSLRTVGNWDFNPKGMTEGERELIRFTYKVMQRVTQDFETRWHFNSAIAQIMELTNEIYAHEPMEQSVRPEIRKEILQTLTLLLAPMTPHLSEELWEMLRHDDGLWNAKWPGFVGEQIELAKDEEVEIPVQVNGRLRGKVKVAVGTGADEVEKLALADPVIAPHLAGKSIVKRIFVPDKLLNLVVA